MLFCQKCGTQSSSDSSFCAGCGSALSLGATQKSSGGSKNSSASSGPETKKSLTTAQVIAISAAGVVLLAGVGVGSVLLLTDPSGGDLQNSTQGLAADGTYGSNGYLDSLWDECENGDFESCDQLFLDAPANSEYEAFGDTCGNRNEPSGYCEDLYSSSSTSRSAAYGSYGSDSYLDALWDNCSDGNFESCDTLFLDSPSDSEYEAFGDSCGNRNEPSGYCVDIYQSSGSSGSSSYGNYGSDSYLDSLWDSCSNADFYACDELFLESPYDSEYEDFGDTCGYRNEPSGYCVDLYY